MAETPTYDIEITRVLEAPAERVFQAFADADRARTPVVGDDAAQAGVASGRLIGLGESCYESSPMLGKLANSSSAIPSKGNSACSIASLGSRPRPRLGPLGVSADAIHRPLISRSRTSTQNAEQTSRMTIMAAI